MRLAIDFGIRGKTALVLGGGGLGRAIATALANEGSHIVLADVDASALEGVRQELIGHDGKVLTL
jgi:3-oxoacyl-[acyl-carrier protein] reductase